jgi:hypothetical protein
MATQSLRLNQETQGTVDEEGHRKIIRLPEGSQIALLGEVAEHPELVDVSWKGQSVRIFAIDFETRTKENALTRAVSVGACGPVPSIKARNEVTASTAQQPIRTPRVRRFNSAGRELF